MTEPFRAANNLNSRCFIATLLIAALSAHPAHADITGPAIGTDGDSIKIGGLVVPPRRLGIVLRHAIADKVRDAEVVLGLGMALLGQRKPFKQRCRVIAALVRFMSGVEILPSRRYGERENEREDCSLDDVVHITTISSVWAIVATRRITASG